jgi:drug/metabolite transporter (DMT)-like permease
VGAVMLAALTRWQGGSLRTRVPAMHFWRAATGVTALSLWFYAIGNLPLGTAVTLNYMSSVWMALFLLGGAVMLGTSRVDGRLVAAILLGFAGVALVLRPTLAQNQLWHGLAGLISGMVAATAYLQITALGRAGEPEYRVVFYFSVGGTLAGLVIALATGGLHLHHTWRGAALLLAVGLLANTAQLLLTRAYATGRMLVNASLQYLAIVFAFAYGVLLFDERITPMALGGVVLIVGAGLAATSLRTKATPKDTQAALTES